MNTSREELQKLLGLLKKDKDEDLKQYTEFIKNSSLQQRKAQGVCWYPVQIKETGYGLGEYPYVVLERPDNHDTPHQFQAGKMAGIFSNKQENKDESANGVIHYVSDNTLKLILYGDETPEWLSEGKIGVNLLFDERSYREMEDGVKRVMKAENNRLAELRDIILGDKQARFIYTEQRILIPRLNKSQNEAVNRIVEIGRASCRER